MKKVLFVVDEKKMGGVSILLSDILNSINIKKYDIDVLVLHNNGDYLSNLPKSVNILYGTSFFNTVDYTIGEVIRSKSISKIYSKIRLVYLMKTKRIGKRIAKERKKILNKKYDVEVAFKDGFCALFTAYGDSIRKYHWLHVDYEKYDCTSKYTSLFQEIFPKFDKIIGISNHVIEKFKEKYSVSMTDVIYNIIDGEKIRKKSLEEKVNFDKSKLNLVAVGRIHKVKGYDRLIDVINKLNNENKINDVVLRIIGDGPEFSNIKNKIKENHLEDKVLLLGKMNNPYPYVKESDLFIMCSHNEGFGNVIIESFVLGVPVLSLEIASIKEIMTDSYGMIYSNSFEGLYNGIRDVLDNHEELDKYKNNLKKYHYDTKKIINQIESLLDE